MKNIKIILKKIVHFHDGLKKSKSWSLRLKETIQILKGLKSRYEEHHGIMYTDQALKAAAELSAKYINDRYLPDKAIDVIDEAGRLSDLSGSFPKKEDQSVRY